MNQKPQPKKKEDLPRSRYSKEAELAVLGSVILDNRAFAIASEMLRSDDFFFPAHSRVFAAMLDMDRDGDVIDSVTLHERVKARGELDAVGGMPVIAQLADGLPKSTNVLHYAKIVKECAGLRNLAFSGAAISEQALDPAVSLNEVMERAETTLARIRESADVKEKAPVLLKDALADSYRQFERLVEGKHALIGDATGYAALDAYTAGWCAGDLVVLGARPSMGKSALLMEFAKRHAQRGLASLIFSLEMSRSSLVLRLACNVARVDSQRLRTGLCDKSDLARITHALGKMGDWPIWIVDTPRMYSGEIVPKVRHYAERYKLKMVGVDYLQLLRARAENRTQEVTAVSRDLKEAAGALGKISGGTLIATAQLTRRETAEPKLEDLRESGQIEQDADVVLFLWNRDKEAKIGQKDPMEKFLKVAKQRNGPVGTVNLTFAPQYTAFEDPQGDGEPQEKMPYKD